MYNGVCDLVCPLSVSISLTYAKTPHSRVHSCAHFPKSHHFVKVSQVFWALLGSFTWNAWRLEEVAFTLEQVKAVILQHDFKGLTASTLIKMYVKVIIGNLCKRYIFQEWSYYINVFINDII